MSESPLSLSDLATAAVIASVVWAIATQSVRAFVGYLSLKFGPEKGRLVLAGKQSDQCRFDHDRVEKILVQQNATISKMLEQNGQQIKALSDASHANELRHQVMLNRFDRIEERVSRSLPN